MSIVIATSVSEAVSELAGGATPIAGGTDLVVGARQGKLDLPESLVAIDRISELARIEQTADDVRIGSMVSHATLMNDDRIVAGHTALADGAALVGSPATRYVGTLGGNVMNGSPAMDTGAPLAVLSAAVELRSTEGARIVPVADLWTGPGTTSAEPAELCTAVVMPARPPASGSAYVRLEYRRAMEIAVVGAAASVTLGADGSVAEMLVALTAVAPTVMSLTGLEDQVGKVPGEEMLAAVADLASAQASPISDLRAGDAYRAHTVGVMARRAVSAAAKRAAGEHIAVPVNRAVGIGAAPGADNT